MPSTSADLERESFGTSSCRRPAGLPTDAPQKVSCFLQLRWLGSEPSRLVEMDAGRVSTHSCFEQSMHWLWILASVFSLYIQQTRLRAVGAELGHEFVRDEPVNGLNSGVMDSATFNLGRDALTGSLVRLVAEGLLVSLFIVFVPNLGVLSERFRPSIDILFL